MLGRQAYFNRGFSFDKLGRFDEAIRDYTKAVDIDPLNAFAYYNRGISYDRKGDFTSAIENFTLALKLDPNNPDFYHNRGFSHRKLGNYEAAIEDYTRVRPLLWRGREGQGRRTCVDGGGVCRCAWGGRPSN